MPAVNGNDIKARAARLRAVGAAQVNRHLEAQLGKTHHILMESQHMGRTEPFTEVNFEHAQPEGQIVTTAILGNNKTQLCA
jgi:threonylcarbamoyladenosine tRNA methylthiotransferase MtaB